jgi:DNA topoisomerase-1
VTPEIEHAKAAGLRYIDDSIPGISRRRTKSGFRYTDPRGNPIADESELARIRSLAIPPAYENVWISPHAQGHVQATARDAKGRKQYRYHKRWREVRDANKYRDTIAFAKALPSLRTRVAADLAKSGMGREQLLATVVRMLEETLLRIGNETARDTCASRASAACASGSRARAGSNNR